MTIQPVDAPSSLPAPAGDPLAALRCRDDILQAMFWMRGEGFGEETDAAALSRLIAADVALIADQLAALVTDGHLEPLGESYRLSENGQQEGGRRFADEFAGLQLTAHGECPPDCPHCEGIARNGCTHCATTRIPEGLGSW